MSRGLAKIDVVPVTAEGFVDPDVLGVLLSPDVLLVSVMAANSETGVLNPVGEIAERVRAAGALFHCDATQMAGRLPFDMERIGADFVSVSGHKICGPGRPSGRWSETARGYARYSRSSMAAGTSKGCGRGR